MPQITTPSVGPDDLVVEPDQPKDRPPLFAFSADLTTKTTNSRSEPLDPRLRCTIHRTRTAALVLDGVSENLRLGKSGDLHPFPIRAPMDEVVPSVFADGSGLIFGTGYKWRIRFVNTDTGEVSGLSPLPRTGWDLGNSGDTELFTGAKVLIGIPSAHANSGVDEVQIFRNTSGQEGQWFLIKQVKTSTTYIEDNIPDADLATALSVSSDYPVSNAMAGRPWPCVKAWHNPANGREYLFGAINMGSYTLVSNFDIKAGEWKVTQTNHGLRSSREGQVLEMEDAESGAASFRDARFNLVQIPDDNTFYLGPKVPDDLTKIVTGTGTDDEIDNVFSTIHDNRDRRTVFISQPNQPLAYDVLEAFFVGYDSDEAVYEFWQMGGVTHAITNQRIYRIVNDATVLPQQTQRISVVADEGQFGLWAGTYTPFGYVFVNDQGVRVFDGQVVRPLGSQSPFSDFAPSQQFATFEPSLVGETLVFYDPEHHLLHVSYVPRGGGAPARELVFDPEAGVWRGLWRRRIFNAGYLLSDTGDPQVVYGDDHGNLFYDQAQTMDGVNWEAANDPPLEGSITAVSSFMVFTTSTDFATADEPKLVGMPILVAKSDGTYTLNWIAGVPANGKIVLQMVPDDALVAGRKFLVGWIDWRFTTAFIDSQEPTHPERFRRLRLRFKKPTAAGTQALDEDKIKVEVAYYGQDEDEEIGVFHEVVTTVDDEDLPKTIYLDVEIDARGRAFQLRFGGQSKQGEPEVTQAVADFIVGSGRTPD